MWDGRIRLIAACRRGIIGGAETAALVMLGDRSGRLAGLPGVRFPDRMHRPALLDFGRDMERGIPAYPVKVGAPYRTYVPAVDADGNEITGIRPPELLAPLAEALAPLA